MCAETQDHEPVERVFRFREEAMASHIEVLIRHNDKDLANSVAGMVFREVDRLEDLLSRFRDGSDIARINHLTRGERILISQECHTCLLQALEIQTLTQGKFDIAAGGFMDLVRDHDGNAVQSTDEHWGKAREARMRGNLKIDPNEPRVSCVEPGLQLDLGGIGKGFVLEQLTELMGEFEIGNYLLSAGGSTLLARGMQAVDERWGTCLSGQKEAFDVTLQDACLSGSGFEVKGSHIIAGGRKLETATYRRVWVKTHHAALADALSTACFLMNEQEIHELKGILGDGLTVWVETHESEIREI